MELLPQLALNFVKLAQVHRIAYDYSRAEWVNGMVLVMIFFVCTKRINFLNLK